MNQEQSSSSVVSTTPAPESAPAPAKNPAAAKPTKASGKKPSAQKGSTPDKSKGGEISFDKPNPKKQALLKKVAKANAATKKSPAKSAAPSKKASAKAAVSKKPVAKRPASKIAAPAKNAAKKKAKDGTNRGGVRANQHGRPPMIKDKKRQTIDFTGTHKSKLTAIAKKLKKEGVEGVSPLIRLILDKHLPAIEKNPMSLFSK